MRILLTADPEIPVPPPLYGGVQRLVDTLISLLQAKGHPVGLIAHPDSTSTADRFFPFPGTASQRRWDTLRNIAAMGAAVQAFQPDVVHSFSRLVYMLPFLTRSLPKVMTYERQPTPRAVQWAARLGGDSLVFAGCSHHISRAGQAAGGTWRTVYNFVELETYTFQPAVAPDAPLVFLSRLERIKGVHTAIAAARRAGRRLLIAGNRVHSDEGEVYWQTEIAPYLGREGIEYVGPVNDAQKNELLGQAVAMIVPIEWEEPFGIVFTEALACGTPVIACPRGAVPEIVRPGVDGFWVNSVEDAVLAIAALPTLNRHACRQRVEEQFSAAAIVNQYEQLYQSLIMRNSSPLMGRQVVA
ncbi:group 1 glycosyl transferase [Leptolyngbya sp. 'hensonii']|uniref:glycosyltransferase n=1 Tax=Leptolyngbya sp. 'hensonii' TaxID=1922337 RepID=UPI0009501351|nr:glycosyltransferase [Leptolyngbya sp. 'hensonii']OLP18522.1 group 1 glycosyl transferase [Leptolyngbya sp. 'hensonii']